MYNMSDLEMADAHHDGEEPSEPIPIAESQGNTQRPTDDIESQEQTQDEGTTELHNQAVLAIIGNHPEKIGPILGLIGVATFACGIGGYFTRGAPAFFTFVFDKETDTTDSVSPDDTTSPDTTDSVSPDKKAILLFYKCLPGIIVLGLLELLYGIWVSRDHSVRARKVAKAILLLSAFLLVVTMDFTGAGVTI